MKLGDVLKIAAEIVIDEKIAEQQLHAASPGDVLTVDLPSSGELEWADGHRHYKVTGFQVVRVS